jgi:hypothetical protein
VVKELVAEIGDVISKMFSTVTALFSAGLRIIVGLIRGAFRLVTGIIRAGFKFIKGALKFSFESIKKTIEKVSKMMVNFSMISLKAFAIAEKGATKAAKEMADMGDNMTKMFMRMQSQKEVHFGFTSDDTASAMFDIVSSGYRDVAKAQMMLHASSQLAIADGSELKNATNALITVYQNFEDQGKSLNDVIRDMAGATTLGRTSLEEMGPALKSVVGLASRASKEGIMDMRDMFASITLMTRKFGRGSTSSSTRFLSRLIESIITPSSRAAKQLKKLGVNVQSIVKKSKKLDKYERFAFILKELGKIDISQIRSFFPTNQARKAWIALTGSAEEYKGVLEDIPDAGAALEAQIKMQLNTIERKFQRLGGVINTIKKAYGSLVADMLNKTIMGDKQMKQWEKIGDIFNNDIASDAMTKLANELEVAFLPLIDLFKVLSKNLPDMIEDILSGDLVDTQSWNDLKDLVYDISEGLAEVLEKHLTWDNVVQTTRAAFATIMVTIEKIQGMFDEISKGEFDFEALKKNFSNLAKLLYEYLILQTTKFVAEFGIMLAELKLPSVGNMFTKSVHHFGDVLFIVLKITVYKIWNLILELMYKFGDKLTALIRNILTPMARIIDTLMLAGRVVTGGNVNKVLSNVFKDKLTAMQAGEEMFGGVEGQAKKALFETGLQAKDQKVVTATMTALMGYITTWMLKNSVDAMKGLKTKSQMEKGGLQMSREMGRENRTRKGAKEMLQGITRDIESGERKEKNDKIISLLKKQLEEIKKKAQAEIEKTEKKIKDSDAVKDTKLTLQEIIDEVIKRMEDEKKKDIVNKKKRAEKKEEERVAKMEAQEAEEKKEEERKKKEAEDAKKRDDKRDRLLERIAIATESTASKKEKDPNRPPRTPPSDNNDGIYD